MRMIRASVVVVLGLVPSIAGAQAAAPTATPKPAVDVTKAMLEAAAKIGHDALKPIGPRVVVHRGSRQEE